MPSDLNAELIRDWFRRTIACSEVLFTLLNRGAAHRNGGGRAGCAPTLRRSLEPRACLRSVVGCCVGNGSPRTERFRDPETAGAATLFVTCRLADEFHSVAGSLDCREIIEGSLRPRGQKSSTWFRAKLSGAGRSRSNGCRLPTTESQASGRVRPQDARRRTGELCHENHVRIGFRKGCGVGSRFRRRRRTERTCCGAGRGGYRPWAPVLSASPRTSRLRSQGDVAGSGYRRHLLKSGHATSRRLPWRIRNTALLETH